MKILVAAVLAAWLGLVIVLGASGAYISPLGAIPFRIAIGAGAPLLVFLALLCVSTSFRSWIMSLDLPLATAVQSWRFAGFAFLALYAHGILPGAFAWPAGLGDMAIGITAPWVALALVRRPDLAASRWFVIWNLLGILDLVVAVGIGATISSLATGAAGEITVAPMAQMPLVLVPAYLVPLFVMLHLSALLQARQAALSNRTSERTANHRSRLRPRKLSASRSGQ